MPHYHPGNATWDKRTYRMMDRAGSTPPLFRREIYALQRSDFILVAFTWGHRFDPACVDWGILRVLMVPPNRRTDEWLGQLEKPIRQVPIDVGDTITFGYFKIFYVWKEKTLLPLVPKLRAGKLGLDDLPDPVLAMPFPRRKAPSMIIDGTFSDD